MNCDQSKELLIDYYYGELTPAEGSEVADHLGSCSACAKEYCRLYADISGVGQALDRQPRPAVRDAQRGRVQREFSPPAWRRLLRLCTFPIPAYQTVLVVCALLLLWTALGGPLPMLSGQREPAPPRATVLEERYDASRIVQPDPNLL